MTQRRDSCPECRGERVELVVVPGRFYCPRCGVAMPGPCEPPAGAQLAIDVDAAVPSGLGG